MKFNEFSTGIKQLLKDINRAKKKGTKLYFPLHDTTKHAFVITIGADNTFNLGYASTDDGQVVNRFVKKKELGLFVTWLQNRMPDNHGFFTVISDPVLYRIFKDMVIECAYSMRTMQYVPMIDKPTLYTESMKLLKSIDGKLTTVNENSDSVGICYKVDSDNYITLMRVAEEEEGITLAYKYTRGNVSKEEKIKLTLKGLKNWIYEGFGNTLIFDEAKKPQEASNIIRGILFTCFLEG